MTHEFDHVRAAFAASLPGRMMAHASSSFAAAWQTSSLRTAFRKAASARFTTSTTESIRAGAVAVATAMGLQALLGLVLPATVKSAIPPAAFAIAALLAMLVAWRSGAVAAALPGSRLVRWLRR